MACTEGSILELELHGFSHDGSAVGRTDGGLAVFVAGGLPGQRVRARITRMRKRLAFAERLETLRPSPDERPAPCPHAAECGGCPWQQLSRPAQLEGKRIIVRDALERIGRLSPMPAVAPVRVPGPSDASEWHCRNKMEFAFGRTPGGSLVLGLRGRTSRTVFDATGCLLQTKRTMAVLDEIRRFCRGRGLQAAAPAPSRERRTPPRKAPSATAVLRHAVIREPESGGCLVEIITSPCPDLAESFRLMGERLLSSGLGVTGFIHSTRSSPSAVAYGEDTVLELGIASIRETLAVGKRMITFRLGHDSFFQVNTQAAGLLYGTAEEAASRLFPEKPPEGPWGGSCWDIYCGAGGLALTMAGHFDSVSGLELVPEAVELARVNAADSGFGAAFDFTAGDASSLENWFRTRRMPDLLVTDPPRSGMDARTTAAILRHRPPRLVLVSCDPTTLARDLAALSTAYAIAEVIPVDLFPQTPHTEAVATLRLAQA